MEIGEKTHNTLSLSSGIFMRKREKDGRQIQTHILGISSLGHCHCSNKIKLKEG